MYNVLVVQCITMYVLQCMCQYTNPYHTAVVCCLSGGSSDAVSGEECKALVSQLWYHLLVAPSSPIPKRKRGHDKGVLAGMLRRI